MHVSSRKAFKAISAEASLASGHVTWDPKTSSLGVCREKYTKCKAWRGEVRDIATRRQARIECECPSLGLCEPQDI